jgi:hypothetical protein
MTDIAGAPSSSTMLRWTTLILIAANMAFVAVYSSLGESPTFAEVVAEYRNALVPAAFAKAIGAAMLIAFLFFYVAALWPSRHRSRVYDRLVIPLALASVLASGWIVAFRHAQVGLCAALIAASVALGGVMFVRVASASPSRHSHWLRVPFSLYFGAMSIALLATLAQWSTASGLLEGAAVAPDDMATVLLCIAAAMGGFVALRYSDFVYPAVIASSLGAMFVAQRANYPDIAADALTVCIGMLVVVGLAAVALANQPRRLPGGKESRRMTRISRREPDDWGYAIEGNSSIMRL